MSTKKLNQLSNQTDTEQKFSWILIQSFSPQLSGGVGAGRAELPVALPAAAASSRGSFCALPTGRSNKHCVMDTDLKAHNFTACDYFSSLPSVFLEVSFGALCLLILLGSILQHNILNMARTTEFSYAEMIGKGREHAIHTNCSLPIPAQSLLGWYASKKLEKPWNSQKWNNLFTKKESF